MTVEVRASDEDDDALVYTWSDALGGGTFGDSTSARTTWTAPLLLTPFDPALLTDVVLDGYACQGIVFPLSVLIRDRQCEFVPDSANRLACLEQAQANQIFVADPFSVTVVQCLPQVTVPAERTATCTVDGCPEVAITAEAVDPDGDQLTYSWEELEGESLALRLSDRAEVKFTPEAPGDYLLQVQVSDGSDTTRATVPIHILGETPASSEDG